MSVAPLQLFLQLKGGRPNITVLDDKAILLILLFQGQTAKCSRGVEQGGWA